jgi:hypothetical protein
MITVILDNEIQTFVYDHCEIETYFIEFLKRLKQYNDETNANI